VGPIGVGVNLAPSIAACEGTGSTGSNSPLVTFSTWLWRVQRVRGKCSTWRPSLSQPSLGESGGRLPEAMASSARFRRPAPLAGEVLAPAVAARHQVLALNIQALVLLPQTQLSGTKAPTSRPDRSTPMTPAKPGSWAQRLATRQT
jgi:hypothetical protein